MLPLVAVWCKDLQTMQAACSNPIAWYSRGCQEHLGWIHDTFHFELFAWYLLPVYLSVCLSVCLYVCLETSGSLNFDLEYPVGFALSVRTWLSACTFRPLDKLMPPHPLFGGVLSPITPIWAAHDLKTFAWKATHFKSRQLCLCFSG